MRWGWRIAAALLAVVVLAASLVASSSGSTTPGVGTLAQRRVAPASGPSTRARIKTLNAAVTRVKAMVAAGNDTWGDLDLRDIFSYQVDRLWARGIDGSGTAVAVLEGWSDPSVQRVVDALDDQIGLPHARIETVYPSGPLPARCPAGMVRLGSYGSCDAWAGELELDVEAVHLLAPYAKIVISATPSDSEVVGDASSEVAMPEMAAAMEYLSSHKIANVISVSDGSSETDYSRGAAEIHAQDVGEVTAAAAGVPIANATGDCGAAQNLTTATRQCGTVSSGPASATWADSPWVTAVGGSSPQHRIACPPCNDATHEDSFPLDPIEGAGLSEMYDRPSYQDSIKSISGSTRRSLPDITMDSADGTSEAAPLFAGVLALATQLKGSNLGPINSLLYGKLAKNAAHNGLVDVTSGNNTFGSIPGYAAGRGYDVASGWGTVDAALFAPALAAAAGDGNPMIDEAATALAALTGTLAITPSNTVASSATVAVTSRGFLPGHPVTLTVDKAPLSKVVADTSGNITYSFTAAGARLAAGTHELEVHSMLLDQRIKFTITR